MLLIDNAVCRLWIVPKGYGDSVEPQQIGYVNVVPARNEFGVFDGFGDTVRKFNQHLRVHPLPGTWRSITTSHAMMLYWYFLDVVLVIIAAMTPCLLVILRQP